MIIREKIFNTVEYYHYGTIHCVFLRYYTLCLFKILYTVTFQDTIHCVFSRYYTKGQEMSDKKK